MSVVSVKILGTDRLLKALDKISKGIPPALVKAMWLACLEVTAQAKLNLAGRSRSGQLMKSIHSDIKKTMTDIVGKVGTNLIYARIQELGGTITPKRARALTIPLRAALTGRGVARGKARDFINTFIAKSIIFQRVGKDIIPLFKLARRVQIRARPFLGPALTTKTKRIEQIFDNTLTRLLKGA